MNLLGYLITLANLQSFDRSAGPVKDLSVEVAEVQNLAKELQAIPGLDLNKFKDTGYYRLGPFGKYLSRNLRDFIFTGQGNPKDEGVILTLIFKDNPDHPLTAEDETLTYFLHKNIGNEEREQVQAYLDGQNYG